MHHMPGLSAASLQAFARLNDCSNWDEVDVTFVQFKRENRKVSNSDFCEYLKFGAIS